MSTKKNLVRVTIQKEDYAIRSDVSPERTRAVAQYLDDAIQRVLDSGSVVEGNRAAILAALQITGELFEARQESDLTERIQALSGEVRRLVPPSKRGDSTS